MAIQTMQTHRRPEHRQSTSLFWPVMLIGAGVLLILERQGRLTGDLLSVLINYWPVIFIVVGIDILFSRTGWLGTLISGFTATAVVIGVAYLLMTPGAGLPLSEQLAFPWSIDLRVDPLSQPLDKVRNARLELSLLGGTSDIGGMSDSSKLFEGSYAHRGAFNQTVRGSGSDVTIQLGRPTGPVIVPFNAGRERMDLRLNDAVRYDLQLAIASGRHVVNLSDLALSGVAVNMASGTVDLRVPESAPYPLDLSMASGTVNITIPRGIPVRINASGLTGAIRGESLRRVSGNGLNGVYETPNFNRTGAYLELNVNMLSGAVNVR